ncbi:MAG: hypothetical protein RLZZ399_2055 [Verrucomicrobiota bacterium]|jgi:cytochrome c553
MRPPFFLHRHLLTWASIGLFLTLLNATTSASAATTTQTQARLSEKHRALLESHCTSCHGPAKQKGKFRVDDLPLSIATLEDAERWQKVLNQLNSGEMPPEGEKQPPRTLKADFLEELANVMVTARRNLSDQKGAITMRRLNRREYKNTLRDMLGVEINVSELPSDTGTGAFDTVGSNLFMSGNQFEQYQSLSREALSEAFDRVAAAGIEKKIRIEAEETFKAITKNIQELRDGAERAEQWAKAVEAAAARPENATVVAEIRKKSKDAADFRRSWKRIVGAPAPEEFGFKSVENNADKANGALTYKQNQGNGLYLRPALDYYLSLPHLDTGAYLSVAGGIHLNNSLLYYINPNWPPGEYMLRVRVGATSDAPRERRFLEFGIHPRSGRVMQTYEITGSIDAPQTLEIPFTLTRKHTSRDDRTVFIREKGTLDHFTQTRVVVNKGRAETGFGPKVALWIDWMEVERKTTAGAPLPPGLAALGIPFDDQAPEIAKPELRKALQRFALEAFRGTPPEEAYVDRLLGIYDARRKAGDKHSAALKETLSVILASPKFLYLAEPTPDDQRRPVTDAELAARLSYFLWSAPPDARLRALAARGELQKPAVLVAEMERLLADPRSEAFVRSFLYQWLGLDRLDFFEINRTLFPRFDDSTKLAARNEIYETFGYILHSNGSLRNLLKSDYAILNGVLALYYGIDGVRGEAFRKVPLPPNSPRGGLLGMAAIHLMGGNGEVTSPVNRGAWVLRKLLDDAPPPAPANVPQIARLAGKVLTTRERLMAHQEDPQCTSCHRKIDPIGFGLENFDAAGQWRTSDSYQLVNDKGVPDPKTKKTWQINPGAAFYKGPTFRDFFEMRNHLAARTDAFTRSFSKALIEYALGRPCGFSDEPLLNAMVQHAGTRNFAIREVFAALVVSNDFRTK